MNVVDEIHQYIESQPEPKRRDLQALHRATLEMSPECKLWFSDGKNEVGKVVSNPNIGYGAYTIQYADGSEKEFFRIGLSGNKTGISVYIMGLDDKTYLARAFGERIGKATVTGYCIRFKSLADIDLEVLRAALRYGLDA
jgi:hypothetical protein